jgi:outer membrane lipoprotein-sorting protein
MKPIKILTTLFLTTILLTAGAQDATELLQKMDDLMQKADDREGTVQITLINKNGEEKVREAEMLQKKNGYRLYRYTKPESQAGIATLSEPDGTMWMYMPAFGSPKKITLLAKSQAFTGTDFSYEDMDPAPWSDRYSAKLLEEGVKSYTLELTPLSDKSSYSKLLLVLDKFNYYPVQIQYFDNKDRKFKVATYKYEKVGEFWNAREVIMTDLKKEHATKIEMTDVKFNQGIPDEAFDVEKLVPEE